jgi:hypothetical protein
LKDLNKAVCSFSFHNFRTNNSNLPKFRVIFIAGS